MNCEFEVNNVDVDAGMILIADLEFFRMYGHEAKKEKEYQAVDMQPGLYDIGWEILSTYNGDVGGRGRLLVTTGEVVVSDPCYLIRDDLWDLYLKNTNYSCLPHPGTVCLDKMGGDGTYDVSVSCDWVCDLDFMYTPGTSPYANPMKI